MKPSAAIISCNLARSVKVKQSGAINSFMQSTLPSMAACSSVGIFGVSKLDAPLTSCSNSTS